MVIKLVPTGVPPFPPLSALFPLPKCRRQRAFHVVIKLAARIDMAQLRQFLRGAVLDIPQIGIQLLDIVLRERPLELALVLRASLPCVPSLACPYMRALPRPHTYQWVRAFEAPTHFFSHYLSSCSRVGSCWNACEGLFPCSAMSSRLSVWALSVTPVLASFPSCLSCLPLLVPPSSPTSIRLLPSPVFSVERGKCVNVGRSFFLRALLLFWAHSLLASLPSCLSMCPCPLCCAAQIRGRGAVLLLA